MHRPQHSREALTRFDHCAAFASVRHSLSDGGVNSIPSSTLRSIRSFPEVIASTAALVRTAEISPINPSLIDKTLSANVGSVRFDRCFSGNMHSKLASSCKYGSVSGLRPLPMLHLGKKSGSQSSTPRSSQSPPNLPGQSGPAPLTDSAIFASASSMVKLADFWRGGNSLNVSANLL
jgi:hypothetical protein